LAGVAAWGARKADELLASFAEAAKQHAIEIVGGDFSRGEKLTIAITAIGKIVTRPLLRSGAKPGDRIYLSRPIGGSATGLHLLDVIPSVSEGPGRAGPRNAHPPAQAPRYARDDRSYADRESAESAMRRPRDPEREVGLGLALARIAEVTSCIDVSD